MMKILIAGASGFIGSALQRELREAGHDVVCLVRRAPKDSTEISWNPDHFELDGSRLCEFDAIVNLSGKNIAAGRWSPNLRQELYESRIKPTRTLVRALAGQPPKTFVSASGIGFYGATRDQACDESSLKGEGFFADLAEAWENEARALNGRFIPIRFGVVLGKDGGALKKMLPVFRLGLGGKLGNGRQMMSWISLTDAVRVIRYAVENDALSGPINGVSSKPVTNDEFTEALAQTLGRRAPFTVPALVLRAVFGKMADETVLGSLAASPRKLVESGFTFQLPRIDEALRHELSALRR